MKKLLECLFVLYVALAAIQCVQASPHGGLVAAPTTPVCSAGVLDTFAASPGAHVADYSMRLLRIAYAGKGIQLQRSSDNATLDIGFNGCDPDTSTVGAFCSTAPLVVGTTSSTRVAFPTGSVIHIFNTSQTQGIFYAVGNSSVTATTASTPLIFGTGANITVGANTNIAAIIGTGYGLNGGAGSATLFLTNCSAPIIYDQSGNGNDMAPVTAGLAHQMGYLPNCAGALPCLFGTLSGTAYKAADSATYKTTTVETFTVMTFGEDVTTSGLNYAGIGYPTTTSSDAQDYRWGLVNAADPDILINNINGSSSGDAEGFGGLWRGQFLTQYDYSTGGITRWNGGTQFLNAGSGTPTYPNAVGLYLMGDAAGNGTPGMFAEALVASGTQTARNSISANQVSYWGVTAGTASSVALANPLGDGWNWNVQQIGGFAPDPPGAGAITINGNAYHTESSWNNYTSWQASNASTASGQAGDLWRFQTASLFDQWDGTNRSELDGAGGAAQFNQNVTFWVAYAIYLEPGTAVNTSWHINGQMHAANTAATCCVFNTSSATTSTSDTWTISTGNATTGAATTQYSVALTRGRWYHFVFQVNVSSSGTNDTFNVWLDPVTAGTMTQVVTKSAATLFGGSTSSTIQYWKYGDYHTTGAPLPVYAPRYGNVWVCSTGTDCMTKYGSNDLSALETTPLADPAHLFLLNRDLNPGSNDNTPAFINKAA